MSRYAFGVPSHPLPTRPGAISALPGVFPRPRSLPGRDSGTLRRIPAPKEPARARFRHSQAYSRAQRATPGDLGATLGRSSGALRKARRPDPCDRELGSSQTIRDGPAAGAVGGDAGQFATFLHRFGTRNAGTNHEDSWLVPASVTAHDAAHSHVMGCSGTSRRCSTRDRCTTARAWWWHRGG